MADIGFTPNFKHEDWIDNQSRVQAAGPDGFNQRFHALEADLVAIADTIEGIATAIGTLEKGPPAREISLTFTPTLVSTSGDVWDHRTGQAQTTKTGAHGMMSVALPHGVKLTKFRVSGRNPGTGDLRIELNRQSLAADTAAPVQENIVRIPGHGDPFNLVDSASAQFELVDTENFSYFINAELNNNSPANTLVVLLAFQITYQTA